jgi:hypothetical protein
MVVIPTAAFAMPFDLSLLLIGEREVEEPAFLPAPEVPSAPHNSRSLGSARDDNHRISNDNP